jgi:HEPN domain-containing protein/predicted nucleotidyltransferase
MKKSLSHLPKQKREELKTVVRMMREEFDVEMIILFGSYARGDWVEELAPDEFHYTYQSDFDILVVADKKLANRHRKWDGLKDRFRRSSVVKTPVTLIHHSIEYLNDQLSKGQYFFSDIKKEGILLYDSGSNELAEEQEMTPEKYRKKAERHYKKWFESSNEFLTGFKDASKRKHYKKAAFELHQATERYYSALLLVLTDYKPKTHDIEELGKLVAAQEPKLLEVFPQGTEEERNRFELLRKAYVDARYEESYSISKEELEWLESRVTILKDLTVDICTKKIDSFATK